MWLSHILSQEDHRLSYVQPWAEKRLQTLRGCTGKKIRGLDWSDDRLEGSLRYLSKDENWQEFERALGGNLIQVYDLKTEKVRLDSTTGSSYGGTNEEGLFQYGHSKDHRPDLKQVKIMLSTLDPMGMPIATEVVAGNKSDDPLYIPAIKKVRNTIKAHGLLYIGDSKMAALKTREEIVKHEDYYLCPLSKVHISKEELMKFVLPVIEGKQPTTNVEYKYSDGHSEIVTNGYEKTQIRSINREGECLSWTERYLIVCSFSRAESGRKNLDYRLSKAQLELEELGKTKKGKKRLKTLEEWSEATKKIINHYKVSGLLKLDYDVKSVSRSVRKYKNRPSRTEESVSISLKVSVDESALQETINLLGWRIYVTNYPTNKLCLNECIVAYRDSYIMERSFTRFKNYPLSLTPMYLQKDEYIKGLIRLLSIGLRVLTLIEWIVRCNLQKENQTLRGLYAGNPQRATSSPTAEKILSAFREINLLLIETNEMIYLHLNSLSSLQESILRYLGFSTNIYTQLAPFDSQPP